MSNKRAYELLETFPELTDDLAEELRLSAQQYLLINSKGEAHCTACQETFSYNTPELEKQEEPDTSCYCTHAMMMIPPKHREKTTCPKCGRLVETVKTWHNFNGYTLEDSNNVVIFLTGKNKALYARCYRTETYFEKRQACAYPVLQGGTPIHIHGKRGLPVRAGLLLQ